MDNLHFLSVSDRMFIFERKTRFNISIIYSSKFTEGVSIGAAFPLG
ncbi:MAG: hypothetical protein RMX68_020120 [Aulosira sp. ZfuVER01]|nr:hypothetical protein [Aulosira sp. DedVER01a]MDZ8054299.1 hypothetical protein [Aulosira sp. ZfuCHP01]